MPGTGRLGPSGARWSYRTKPAAAAARVAGDLVPRETHRNHSRSRHPPHLVGESELRPPVLRAPRAGLPSLPGDGDSGPVLEAPVHLRGPGHPSWWAAGGRAELTSCSSRPLTRRCPTKAHPPKHHPGDTASGVIPDPNQSSHHQEPLGPQPGGRGVHVHCSSQRDLQSHASVLTDRLGLPGAGAGVGGRRNL